MNLSSNVANDSTLVRPFVFIDYTPEAPMALVDSLAREVEKSFVYRYKIGGDDVSVSSDDEMVDLDGMQVTEIAIVNDDQVENEIKTQEEIQQSETAIGTTDFDQGTDDINVVREHKKPELVADNHVFQSVDQMPQFPGGDEALLKFLAQHIKYPPVAGENNIQGRVTVQFVVKKDGSIGEVKVVRSVDPDLDREAVRVVRSLPRFTPGKLDGQPVNVYYTVPINFRLQ